MIEHMGWVVLTFTTGRCTETDWPACPMSADWFETREEAVVYCDTLPGWTSPHLMPVTRRGEFPRQYYTSPLLEIGPPEGDA